MIDDVSNHKMIGQLNEELVKALTRARLQIKAKPEVEMTHPKIYMKQELRGREVCQQPSGFMSSWLPCSLNFDKYYPKRFPKGAGAPTNYQLTHSNAKFHFQKMRYSPPKINREQ